eukprot:c52998_g1_i1.p1 GENE.c52998_g1_i1~~c52998_g1_i1.p1  ORF type:complete len:416 (-),score=102.95 c52998_g1_i1:96-1343(-)
MGGRSNPVMSEQESKVEETRGSKRVFGFRVYDIILAVLVLVAIVAGGWYMLSFVVADVTSLANEAGNTKLVSYWGMYSEPNWQLRRKSHALAANTVLGMEFDTIWIGRLLRSAKLRLSGVATHTNPLTIELVIRDVVNERPLQQACSECLHELPRDRSLVVEIGTGDNDIDIRAILRPIVRSNTWAVGHSLLVFVRLMSAPESQDSFLVDFDEQKPTLTFDLGVGCGDAFVNSTRSLASGQPFETCDDGNHQDGDGCDKSCKVEAGYTCPANVRTLPYCRPVCGNGVEQLTLNEQCDDGNLISGDGCSSTCQIEDGYTCYREISTSVCFEKALCGNGVRNTNEQCDDGNDDPNDGCDQCIVNVWFFISYTLLSAIFLVFGMILWAGLLILFSYFFTGYQFKRQLIRKLPKVKSKN